MKKLLAMTALAIAFPASAQTDGANPVKAVSPQRAGFERMIQDARSRVASVNAMPELRGTGPYPAIMEVDLAFPTATIYRPDDLAGLGKRRLGLVLWGNGACSDDGASAHRYLSELASHGYLVIAPGRPLTGPLAQSGAPTPAPMRTTVNDLRAALEWALAENGRRGSPFYRRINPLWIAAAGHSCGAMQAMILADDPRIATLIINNSSLMPVLPDNPPLVMHEQRLRGIRRPTLMILGGESDIVWRYALATFDKLNGVPVFLGSHETGHEGTFAKVNGGENARVAVEWLQWQLEGNPLSAGTFAGNNCRLCADPSWSVRKKGLR